MPPSLRLVAQRATRAIRIVATHVYVWVRPILIEAGREVLDRGQEILAGWTAKCVSLSSYFGVADVL